MPSWHTVHGQTCREQQTFAPLGQTESSNTPFYSILNSYIRSESVLSRPLDFRISRASKMLNADSVFVQVCEAGRVRVISSYLIFLPLSHLQCGFGELICSHGSVYLAPEQKWVLSAHAYSWVNSTENIMLITALVCSEVSFPLLHHLQTSKGISWSEPASPCVSFVILLCLQGQPSLEKNSFFPPLLSPFHFWFFIFIFLRGFLAVPCSPTTDSCAHCTSMCVWLFLPRRFVYKISTSLRKSCCHRPYGSFL